MATSSRISGPGRQQYSQVNLTHETISARAHEIFLREGSVHGHDQEHWIQAIEELTEETAPVMATGLNARP